MRKLADLINKSQWGGENHDIASVLGDEAVVSNITRFQIGNKAIDYALGGGVPRNKIIELYGAESCGKSTMVYHMIASYQKKYPNEGILLIDTESGYDPVYAENLGVNAKGIIHVPAESGIGALNIAKMAAESGGANLIIIDSIAALTTKSDEEGNIGEQMMAEQARMISQAFRVLNSMITKHDLTFIVTNQVRENIGQSYGDKTVTPAGKALKHYAHIRAKLTRINQIKQKINGEEVVVGIDARFDCVKNKVAPPFRKADYSITFGLGIDNVISSVNLGIEKGVIIKKGGWFNYNGVQTQGLPVVVEMFRKDQALLDKLNADIDAVIAKAASASMMSEAEIDEAKKDNQEDNSEVESV